MSLEFLNVTDDSFLNQNVLYPALGTFVLDYILTDKERFISRPSLVYYVLTLTLMLMC